MELGGIVIELTGKMVEKLAVLQATREGLKKAHPRLPQQEINM